ncbi:hypothetical protein ACIA5C_00440 [Actinoplanes sp. NPDC051343]|uniref:hypothetical protein n=1 Tax=Actinoplanes sp. NPDC051343 TaxID=3363906 RepID=UPI0037B2D00E
MTLVRPATDLDEVAAVWESLVRHHYEVNPEIGRQAPPVGPEASWAGRRRQYEAWSAELGWIMVVAGNDAAQRFYARLGAVEFTRTSIFPV